jgi:Putative adhesin
MTRKLFLTAMVFVATTLSAATRTETIDRTFDVRPGATVKLSNVNGRITVSAWDQPRVKVVATKKVEADSDDIASAMKELRVDLQPRDGGLVIDTVYPKNDHGGSLFSWLLGDHVQAQVTYELTVPRAMNVDVSNTNGAIHLTGVAGTHELDTTNGKIEVARCGGSLDASTTNGSIHAELTTVNKGQPLRFETTNGRIEIELPSNLALDLDASTTNGSIDSELPVSTKSVSRNSLRGSINGGGTSLRMRTTNGGIAIRTAGKS